MADLNKHSEYDVKRLSDEEHSLPTDGKDKSTLVTEEDGETFVLSESAERALVWKFDVRILPLLALMYLFNSLDKSNLGNSKTVRTTNMIWMA